VKAGPGVWSRGGGVGAVMGEGAEQGRQAGRRTLGEEKIHLKKKDEGNPKVQYLIPGGRCCVPGGDWV